jgi:hypothetical protein
MRQLIKLVKQKICYARHNIQNPMTLRFYHSDVATIEINNDGSQNWLQSKDNAKQIQRKPQKGFVHNYK